MKLLSKQKIRNDNEPAVDKHGTPYLCVHNIELALKDLKDFLYADNKRWSYLHSVMDMGLKEGLVKSRGRDLWVNNVLTSIAIELEPTKYQILKRISKRYGIRSLGVAFTRAMEEDNYFAKAEYLKASVEEGKVPMLEIVKILHR